MLIALDCDETLLFTGQTLSDYYKFSVDKNANMPANIWSSQWPIWNGDKMLWKEWFNTWINSEWYTKMPAFPGATSAVKKLKSEGHILYVVSAGLKSATERRRKHLESIFGSVFEDVFVVDNAEEKTQVLKDLQIDVFIDDDLKNLLRAGKHIKCIAIKQDGNQHQIKEINPLPNNITIVNNWKEIIDILRKPLV